MRLTFFTCSFHGSTTITTSSSSSSSSSLPSSPIFTARSRIFTSPSSSSESSLPVASVSLSSSSSSSSSLARLCLFDLLAPAAPLPLGRRFFADDCRVLDEIDDALGAAGLTSLSWDASTINSSSSSSSETGLRRRLRLISAHVAHILGEIFVRKECGWGRGGFGGEIRVL